MDKKQIREQILILRDIQTSDEIFTKSKIIKDRLFGLREFKESRTVMFYVSFKSEVKTHNMIKESINNGKKIVVPKVNRGKKTLEIFQITDFDSDLEGGIWGIPEPKENCRKVDIKDIDLVVVPAVAYDILGYRVGYGGGYYDRFLKEFYTLNKPGTTVGLAYELQIIEKVPLDKFDQKVNFIITEERIIKTQF